MEEARPGLANLIDVRHAGTLMRLDLAALVTLIQQRAVDARTEVRSAQLTGNEWRRLGELELYRTLRPDAKTVPSPAVPQTETDLPPLARAEQNLVRYFNSPAITQLRRDALVSIVAAGVTAGLSVLVHRYVLILLLSGVGWVVSYFLTTRVLFHGWIGRVRRDGFTRLPWQSRVLVVVGIALPGYFLIASVLPLLPGEVQFRWIDGAIAVLFAGASAAIWAFRVETGRVKRVFELSQGADAKEFGDR